MTVESHWFRRFHWSKTIRQMRWLLREQFVFLAGKTSHLLLVYLVTALVPSVTACSVYLDSCSLLFCLKSVFFKGTVQKAVLFYSRKPSTYNFWPQEKIESFKLEGFYSVNFTNTCSSSRNVFVWCRGYRTVVNFDEKFWFIHLSSAIPGGRRGG